MFAIIGAVRIFYFNVPYLFSGEGSIGWASLRIIIGIIKMILGYGLIRIFKKSLDLFVSPLLFFPLIGYFSISLLNSVLYQGFSGYRIPFDLILVSALVFMIYCWFDFRKKYPEAWGLGESKLPENPNQQ